MATANTEQVNDIGKLNIAAQVAVLKFTTGVLDKHKQFTELQDKFDAIDTAYARYKSAQKNNASGIDAMPEATVACNVFAEDDVVPPIVVSQVDSFVAYLAEVFISGTPLFPVVAPPSKRKYAEALEAIIDDHSIIGGYARQLLLFLRDGAKYNFSALEVEWASIDNYSLLQDVGSKTGQSLKRGAKKFNKLKRLNPRNTVWDWSVAPGDVAENGDYAGYIERMSRTKLKRLMNRLQKEGRLYGRNIERAFTSATKQVASWTPNYKDDPIISEYISSSSNRNASPNWDSWFEGDKKAGRRGSNAPSDAVYEVFYLYARIMPADFGIQAPGPNTPQIWKFTVVNNNVVIAADRIISAYDYLPILFGQPLEDGLGYQTQSIAEGEIPFQEAANTLFNIRFAAARRAVSDRALYMPDMISPEDINSSVPAPKIPVSLSVLSTKTLADAYHPIPFDMRGLETVMQDAAQIVQFSKELHGVNSPRQGQFQKGNKSVQEWQDTMGGSDGRMRLPAVVLEHQVFSPLKSIIALNILQYGEDGMVTSQNGRDMAYKMQELRQANLTFKMADGFTPKSKLASTDVIMAGMQMIGNSPALQQAFGSYLPKMFIHFMSISGARGFDEFDPAYQDPAMLPQGPAANVQTNNIQQPGQPGAQPTIPQIQNPAQPVAANTQPVA